MNFSEKIKQIRQQRFLSQEAFAKELGVSFATVNRWEAGKTKPTYKTMKLIDIYCSFHLTTADLKCRFTKILKNFPSSLHHRGNGIRFGEVFWKFPPYISPPRKQKPFWRKKSKKISHPTEISARWLYRNISKVILHMR